MHCFRLLLIPICKGCQACRICLDADATAIQLHQSFAFAAWTNANDLGRPVGSSKGNPDDASLAPQISQFLEHTLSQSAAVVVDVTKMYVHAHYVQKWLPVWNQYNLGTVHPIVCIGAVDYMFWRACGDCQTGKQACIVHNGAWLQ